MTVVTCSFTIFGYFTLNYILISESAELHVVLKVKKSSMISALLKNNIFKFEILCERTTVPTILEHQKVALEW